LAQFSVQFNNLPTLVSLGGVAGELIVIAKQSIYSQSCSELAVTYHSLNEGNQHFCRGDLTASHRVTAQRQRFRNIVLDK
jgi:hypothetical protein